MQTYEYETKEKSMKQFENLTSIHLRLSITKYI